MTPPDETADTGHAAIAALRNQVVAQAPAELEVLATDDGFDVVYREELTQRGVLMRTDSTLRVVVRCEPETLTFTMTDVGTITRTELADAHTGAHRSVQGSAGRAHVRRTVEAHGRRADGSWGPLGTQRQDSRELHAAVRAPAADLGWLEQEPAAARVGRYVAVATGVGLAIGVVIVGALALTGAFS